MMKRFGKFLIAGLVTVLCVGAFSGCFLLDILRMLGNEGNMNAQQLPAPIQLHFSDDGTTLYWTVPGYDWDDEIQSRLDGFHIQIDYENPVFVSASNKVDFGVIRDGNPNQTYWYYELPYYILDSDTAHVFRVCSYSGLMMVEQGPFGLGGNSDSIDSEYSEPCLYVPMLASGDIAVPWAINYLGNAFENRVYVTGVKIPSSVRGIAYNAFRNCPMLTNIYYMDSESDWYAMGPSVYNIPIDATVHFNCSW